MVLKEDCSEATIQEVLDNFTSLLERVQGTSIKCLRKKIRFVKWVWDKGKQKINWFKKF